MTIFKGPSGPLSAFNRFLKHNLDRWNAGITPYTQILKVAPIGIPRPEGFATTTATVVNNTIVFSWTCITNVPTTSRLQLWIRSTDAKVYVQLAGTAPVFPAGSITITQVKKTSGVPISLPPGKYDLQAQVCSIDGLHSAPSQVWTVRLGPDNFRLVEFSPRSLLVNLPGIVASVPWTTLSVAGLVPANANALLVYAEAEFAGGLGLAQVSFELRKDSTQGISFQKIEYDDTILSFPKSDNGILPLTSALTFDYRVTYTGAPPVSFNFRVYAIGYIY
jgi:hypothetical protein